MLESEVNQSTRVRSCAIAVEQIQADEGDGVSDKKIMSLIMRCHVNLGHPSLPRLVGMLKAARASDRALKLARGLTRSTCEPVKGEKTYRVARVENATRFNQMVCLDTFDLGIGTRKVRFFNMIDAATR